MCVFVAHTSENFEKEACACNRDKKLKSLPSLSWLIRPRLFQILQPSVINQPKLQIRSHGVCTSSHGVPIYLPIYACITCLATQVAHSTSEWVRIETRNLLMSISIALNSTPPSQIGAYTNMSTTLLLTD